MWAGGAEEISSEVKMKDSVENAAVVQDGTVGYLFGDGSEGPSAGNEEGLFAYNINYDEL